ncbi:hypothetical protein TWF569_004270 [Orbilia oligospora]|nr:hypothetical protein TWF569_004270 [Orbilia oligospora]
MSNRSLSHLAGRSFVLSCIFSIIPKIPLRNNNGVSRLAMATLARMLTKFNHAEAMMFVHAHIDGVPHLPLQHSIWLVFCLNINPLLSRIYIQIGYPTPLYSQNLISKIINRDNLPLSTS